MTSALWQTLIRNLALVGFWVFVPPSLLWIYMLTDFFVVRPSVYQTALFGHPIAGLVSLRSAKDDCCILPLGDGEMRFTYVIDAETARKLAAGCRHDADRNATVNYFRTSGECVVRYAPFKNAFDGGYDATVKGNILGIEAEWM